MYARNALARPELRERHRSDAENGFDRGKLRDILFQMNAACMHIRRGWRHIIPGAASGGILKSEPIDIPAGNTAP